MKYLIVVYKDLVDDPAVLKITSLHGNQCEYIDEVTGDIRTFYLDHQTLEALNTSSATLVEIS